MAQNYLKNTKDFLTNRNPSSPVISLHQGPTMQTYTAFNSPKPQQAKKSFTPLHMVSGMSENPYHPHQHPVPSRGETSTKRDLSNQIKRSFSSHLLFQTEATPDTIEEEDNYSESIYCTLPSRTRNKKKTPLSSKRDAPFSMPTSPTQSIDSLWTRRDSSARSLHGSQPDFSTDHIPFDPGHSGRVTPTGHLQTQRRGDATLARQDSGIHTSQSDLSGDFSQSRFHREMDSVIKNLSQKQSRGKDPSASMSSSQYQKNAIPPLMMSSLHEPFLSYSDISGGFSSQYKDSDTESIDSRSTLTEGPRYSLTSEPRYSLTGEYKYPLNKHQRMMSASHHDISNNYKMSSSRRNSCTPGRDSSLGEDWRRRKDSLSSGYITDRKESYEQNYQRDRKCSVTAPPQHFLPDLQLRPLQRQDSSSAISSPRRDSTCSLPPSHLFMPNSSANPCPSIYSSQLSLYLAPVHNRDITLCKCF